MTLFTCYTECMNTLLLISTLALGGIWSAVLLLICFLCVHLIKLAKIGFDTVQNPPEDNEEEKKISDGEKPSDSKPVYCFIERKQKGKTTVYTKPKRLHFK